MLVNVKNGTIISSDWSRTLRGLHDGQYQATIRKKRDIRSLNQNRYYWGVVIAMIVEHTGQDAEDIHEYLADLFLSERKEIELAGKIRKVTVHPTTTKLKTTEFIEYTENIRSWAAWELSIRIPSPNEVNYE